MTQGATSPAWPHFASSLGVGWAVPAVTPPRAGSATPALAPRDAQTHGPGRPSPQAPGNWPEGGGESGLALRPGLQWRLPRRLAEHRGCRSPRPGSPPVPAQGGLRALHAARPGAARLAQRLLRWRRRNRRIQREVRLAAGSPGRGTVSEAQGALQPGWGLSSRKGATRWRHTAGSSPLAAHGLTSAPVPRSSPGAQVQRLACPPRSRRWGVTLAVVVEFTSVCNRVGQRG